MTSPSAPAIVDEHSVDATEPGIHDSHPLVPCLYRRKPPDRSELVVPERPLGTPASAVRALSSIQRTSTQARRLTRARESRRSRIEPTVRRGPMLGVCPGNDTPRSPHVTRRSRSVAETVSRIGFGAMHSPDRGCSASP